MTNLRAVSTWNMCWTYDPLLLINSLKMVPWCWSEEQLVWCFIVF